MTTPAALLVQLLKDDATVAALVAGRVYPLRIEQGQQLPAVTYQQVGGSNSRCSSYGRYRFQLSMFSASYAQAVAVEAAVRGALDGYEAGEVAIEADNVALDHFSEGATTYYRTQDFFIDFPNS